MAEALLERKGVKDESGAQTAPPTLPLPTTAAGSKQDVFSLDEGQIVLQWPSKMSKENYEDFKAWIEIQVRKIGRAVE